MSLSGDIPLTPWGPQPVMQPVSNQHSPDTLPFRSWQLQNDNEAIPEIITRAKEFGVNNIQLSHDLVMFAHKLMKDDARIERYNEYIKLAHKEGISVHIWTHEFAGLPKSITSQPRWFDEEDVWDFLDERYTRLFELMPELDGIVLTFHETDIKVFDVESELPLNKRVAKLINRLHDICEKSGKTLVARTFAYEPKQVEGVAAAFSMVSPDVIIMTKCIPHDWQVFYPHNPAIGHYPDRKQIIEFDPGAEYYGKGHVPYLYPEYLHFRLQYARERNCQGYVARIEREKGNPPAVRGISPESGYNELNLYALKRFSEDPSLSADEVWREYLIGRVGEGAYIEPLMEALKLTDDSLNRCYFMLGCWYNDHSRLPSRRYGAGHIRFIRKWNPSYQPIIDGLDNRHPDLVNAVLKENRESVELAKLALSKLEEAKAAGLSPEHYAEYKLQLDELLKTARKWAEHREKFIMDEDQ